MSLSVRAVTRLNNEEVLGSKIKVKIKTTSTKQSTSQLTATKENIQKKNPHQQQQTNGGPVYTNLKIGKSKSMMALTRNSSDNLAGGVKNQKDKKGKQQQQQILMPFQGTRTGSQEFLNKQQQQQQQFRSNLPLGLPTTMYSMQIPPNLVPRFVSPPLIPPVIGTPVGGRMQPPMPLIRTAVPFSPRTTASTPNQKNVNSNSASSGGGFELLISNLDPAVDGKEIEKLVREHCRLISMSLEKGKKNKIRALVKVPKLQDARLCIEKLNNRKVLSRNIQVSLQPSKDQVTLKNDVSSLLKGTWTNWMPLDQFLMLYKDRYKKSLHVLDLDQIKDVIYVDGKPGRQFICLLHFNIGSVKIKQNANFSNKIVNILQTHNRKVPFSR